MMSCEEMIKAAIEYYENSEQGGYVYMDVYDRLLEYQHIPHHNEWHKHAREVMVDQLGDGDTILDWGCGRGTLGTLGKMTIYDKTLDVDGYDLPESGNRYTDKYYLWQLKPHYDAIIASHILEHCPNRSSVIETLKLMGMWADKLIVFMPNAHHNPLVDFTCDDTHIFPYNNPFFFRYCELAGWRPTQVIKCDLPDYALPWRLGRVAWSILVHTSPFMNWCCVCEKEKERK